MADESKILAAIEALDGKVDGVRTDIAGLKKTDETLATEVARLGDGQRRQEQEMRELRNETLRTFESERHASAQTFQAITKHVDDSARAYQEKAADLDTVKKDVAEMKAETTEQTQMLKDIVGSPTAKKVGTALAALIVAAAGYGVVRLQASVSKLEEKPATVQPAPTVYLPVYVPTDGGVK